jgi:hypothetical protein
MDAFFPDIRKHKDALDALFAGLADRFKLGQQAVVATGVK